MTKRSVSEKKQRGKETGSRKKKVKMLVGVNILEVGRGLGDG